MADEQSEKGQDSKVASSENLLEDHSHENKLPAPEKAKKTVKKKTVAKKKTSTAKKSTAKKATTKKASVKKTTAKKTTTKKAAPKSASSKSASSKKTTAKKATIKKTTAKKATPKKATAKKPAAKKTTRKKPAVNVEKVGKITASKLKATENEIDRAMKKAANTDVRFLNAQEKLADLQATLKVKMAELKVQGDKRTKKAVESARIKITKHKEVIKAAREKRKEALHNLKKAESMHKAHERIAEKIEQGKLKAQIEAKKAEIAFLKGLHRLEEKWLNSLEKSSAKKKK